jgi:hypothetical protein
MYTLKKKIISIQNNKAIKHASIALTAVHRMKNSGRNPHRDVSNPVITHTLSSDIGHTQERNYSKASWKIGTGVAVAVGLSCYFYSRYTFDEQGNSELGKHMIEDLSSSAEFLGGIVSDVMKKISKVIQLNILRRHPILNAAKIKALMNSV